VNTYDAWKLASPPEEEDDGRGRIPTVPCTTCGKDTPMLGTRLCDACWEVEHRLDAYLRDGGERAVAFVRALLDRERSGSF
jgi:hypothetical protein